MKKTIVFLLCTVIIAMTLTPICAVSVDGSALSVELLKYYRYETEQIALMLNDAYGDWDDYLGDEPEAISYDLMYQVYYLDMKDIVAAYDTDGSFAKNISDKYYWVVPNYEKQSEVQVVRNADTTYGWAVRRGTRYMKSIADNHKDIVFGVAEIYESILEQCPDANKLSFKMVYDELNDMHLMYFTVNGEEYLSPYFASKDITWLTNGKAYTVGNFIERMRDNAEQDTTRFSLFGENDDTETIYFYYIVIGTVVVVAIALLSVIIAGKKIRARNEAKEENDKKE